MEHLRMDGYVRVSRLMGREGDSFISPDEQRRKIEGWAKLRDVQIIAWHEDLDQSGGKLSRPGLDAMLARIDAKETEGVVVAKLDRLSRLGVADALKLVERITEVGAGIAAVDLGLDPTTPFGEFGMTIMLALARMERRRLTDEWENARKRAAKDGVHLAPVPAGYMREDGPRSRLTPDPDAAPAIHEVFRRRAAGESLLPLAKYLTEQGIPMSKSGIRKLLENRVYLGEASGACKGEWTPDVHEPILTVEEFEAVELRRGAAPIHDGSIAAQGMLTRIIKCAGCGGTMSVGGANKRADGTRVARYFCRGHSAAGPCPAPAGAMVPKLDDYVRESITTALTDGTLKATADAIRQYNRAADAATQAQADLDAIKTNTGLIASLGVDGVAELAASQKAILDSARQTLADTPRPETTVEPDSLLWDKWDIEDERAFCRQVISEVRLKRGGKGRGALPIHERVEIRWAGHDDFDTSVYARGAEARETAARLRAG